MDFGNKKQKEPVGINIASMVDILFIILIFVLVSTTFIEQPGLDIELPHAKSARMHYIKKLVLNISKTGKLFLNNNLVKKENLPVLLRRYIKQKKEKNFSVVLRADKEAKYGLVIEIMDIMHQAGVKKLVAQTNSLGDAVKRRD